MVMYNTQLGAWTLGDLNPSPSSENIFQGNLGHLSFPFYKTRTIIHAECVPRIAGLGILPRQPLSSGLARESLSEEKEGKVCGEV